MLKFGIVKKHVKVRIVGKYARCRAKVFSENYFHFEFPDFREQEWLYFQLHNRITLYKVFVASPLLIISRENESDASV